MDLDIYGNKVVFHNLSLRGNPNYQGLSSLFDFDQRAVVYTQENDVLVTRSSIDSEYIKYLKDFGWGFDGVTFFLFNEYSGKSENIFPLDQEIIDYVKNSGFKFYLDVFAPTEFEDILSKKLEIPLYGSSHFFGTYGTKSGFRLFTKKIGLSVVDGIENIKTVVSAKNAIDLLFAKGKEEIALKDDKGSAGFGIWRMMRREYILKSDEQKLAKIKEILSLISIMEGKEGSLVIEEWIRDIVSHPSVQAEIFPNGDFCIHSIHEQLLFQKQFYYGCMLLSFNPLIHKRLIQYTETFIHHIHKDNFIGFLGLDFIVTRDGQIYCVEANMRKTATFYPRIIARKLGLDINNSSYIAATVVRPRLAGWNFSELFRFLKEFHYPIHGRRAGIVVSYVGSLFKEGVFEVVSFGEDIDEAFDIYIKVKRKIDIQ